MIVNRVTKVAAIAVAVLLLGWLYAAPYLAYHGLQAAAQRRDAVALADHVDFPALRQSLKASFMAQMTKDAVSATDNPFAAFGTLLAQTFLDRMIDGLITPEGLAAMMKGAPPRVPQDTPASGPGSASRASTDQPIVSMGYETMSRFTVRAVSRGAPESEIAFVFLRNGLSWKLSAIRLPQVASRPEVPRAPPKAMRLQDQENQGKLGTRSR